MEWNITSHHITRGHTRRRSLSSLSSNSTEARPKPMRLMMDPRTGGFILCKDTQIDQSIRGVDQPFIRRARVRLTTVSNGLAHLAAARSTRQTRLQRSSSHAFFELPLAPCLPVPLLVGVPPPDDSLWPPAARPHRIYADRREQGGGASGPVRGLLGCVWLNESVGSIDVWGLRAVCCCKGPLTRPSHTHTPTPPPTVIIPQTHQEAATMPLETTIVCVDNSDWMRNGDYIPTRFEAQHDAVNLVTGAKTQQNPENTVCVCVRACVSVCLRGQWAALVHIRTRGVMLLRCCCCCAGLSSWSPPTRAHSTPKTNPIHINRWVC